MQSEGSLVQWNEDRGFGFIEVAGTFERLFVHISAFERGRVRPPLGARLVFDVERDAQGRKRAVNVTRPGDLPARPVGEKEARPGLRHARTRRARSPAWILVAIACVAVAVGVRHARQLHAPEPVAQDLRANEPGASAVQPNVTYACDGRTRCSQMRSCAEATWFLSHCPGVQMDGNHDGVPCERQWCDSP